MGNVGTQKMAVNLAKGIFRFTTGALDKKAYNIQTPTAAIGVRGTVLDIDVRNAQTRVTLVEGHAFVCPRRNGVTLDQQVNRCARGGRCDCERLLNAGQTAQVTRVGGSNRASMSSTPVSLGSLCSDPSLCSGTTYADASAVGGGAVLCGR